MNREKQKELTQMTARRNVIDAINHVTPKAVPYVLNMEGPAMEKLDEYYGTRQWRGRVRNSLAYPLHVSTIQERPFGEGRVIDAFGAIWRVSELGAPTVEKPSLDGPTFGDYKWPEMAQFTDQIYSRIDEAKRNCEEMGDRYLTISMGWGLFEQSWRMRGFENTLMDCLLEPAFYGELVARIAEYYMAMIEACREVPADAFLLGDDWGTQNGMIMSPDVWRKFLKPEWQKLYEAIHKQGKKVMNHSCGSVEEIIPDIIDMGMDVLESCQPEALDMNPYALKAKYGDRLTFFGALGNQSTIQFGTPAEIKAEIRKLRREMGKGGGYILAAAKPVQAETPMENVAAVFEAFTEEATANA